MTAKVDFASFPAERPSDRKSEEAELALDLFCFVGEPGNEDWLSFKEVDDLVRFVRLRDWLDWEALSD